MTSYRSDGQVPNTLHVLECAEAAAPLCRHVRIDMDAVAAEAEAVDLTQVSLPEWNFPVFYRADADLLASQVLLFNAINFCYWGDPKWEVCIEERWWGGSMAMLGAISRAFADGIPLTDPHFLAEMSPGDFRDILRGRGQLLLLEERLAIWRDVGRALVQQDASRLTHVITAARGDALGLVQALLDLSPTFEDSSSLGGHPVYFYKRAQLAAAMLFELFRGEHWGNLARVDRLTVFADYKVPQVLRRLGILVYSAELAESIDMRRPIPAGDPREVEIRVATVWAAELLRRALATRMPGILALQVDFWLWYAGRNQGPGIRPHHRTLTTAY